MVQVLTKTLLLIVLFFIAACPGLKFLRLVSLRKSSSLELFVLSVACGFALISEALLALGMIGYFTPMAILIIVIGLFVISYQEAMFFLKVLYSSLCSFTFTVSSYYFLMIVFGIFIVINVLKALLPPHGPTDVLYYHMTLPKLYLVHGSIITNPTFFPSFLPSNGELLFSLCLILGGPVFVNLTVFGFSLLTVMGLYAYTQKYFKKEFALIPGIIYLTAPVVNSWGTMAYTCNILGFYLFLLCMGLFECNCETNWKKVFPLGLLTGMALGIKYQAIPLIGLIYLFFLMLKIKLERRLLLFLIFSLSIGLILSSPWFIRNLLATQNPFFPILRDLFPSEIIKTGANSWIGTEGGELFFIAYKKLKDSYFIPFSFLLSGALENEDFQRMIGPLFLGFFPFVFFISKNSLKWPFIFLICLFSFFATFFFEGNIRYVIILIILLSFLCGAVGQEILFLSKNKGHIFLSSFLSIVVLLYSLHNYHIILSHKRIQTALNPKLTPLFLRAYERSYYPAEFANQNIPDNAKVLFHGLVRYFYFKFEPLNDHLSQTLIVYDEAKNGEDILGIMRNHGITHIICLDEIPEIERSNTVLYDKDSRFVEFTHRYLKKIFTANGITIYNIIYS